MIRTIAVIGAGTAGRSFALACVNAGFHVILEDVMPANLRRAEEQFEENRHPERGASSPSRGTPAFVSSGAPHLDSEMWDKKHGSLSTALTVADAVRTADLAIDFVPDELESKLEIFSMLDRMAPPRTILLTPSDAQSITDLASCTYRPTLCLAIRGGLAPGSPTHLVHPGSTSKEALHSVVKFLRALGCDVSIASDPIAPMLLKNQSSPLD